MFGLQYGTVLQLCCPCVWCVHRCIYIYIYIYIRQGSGLGTPFSSNLDETALTTKASRPTTKASLTIRQTLEACKLQHASSVPQNGPEKD